MHWLTPIWLWLLVPWAVVTVWMLRARGREVGVPFVMLWREARAVAPVRRGIRLPSAGVLLLLGAMLLAIVAAGQPAIRGVGDVPPFTLIVDRGAGVADRPAGGWAELAERLADQPGLSRRVRLVVVPGDAAIATDLDQLGAILDRMTPTALATGEMLQSAAATALRDSDQPVIVVTPRAIDLDHPRLAVLHPPAGLGTAAIAHLAYRHDPRPQVMVRVMNQSIHSHVRLRVDVEGNAIERVIDLPGSGEARSYFVDVPGARSDDAAAADATSAGVVFAELRMEDDSSADNRAWLVRDGAWPRIEPADPLPPAIDRMIAIYTAARPPGRDAPVVLISRQPLDDRVAGVVLPQATRRMDTPAMAAVAHPVMEKVTFDAIQSVRVTDAPLPEGFAVILSADDQPVIAVRDQPTRQVWIGMETAALADQPMFVVLWANVLRWAGGDGVRYTSDRPRTLGADWRRIAPEGLAADVQPGWVDGVYRDVDGRRVAINGGTADGRLEQGGGWGEALSVLGEGMESAVRGAWGMASWLLVGAVGMAGFAAVCWPAAGLTRPYKRRTVRK